MKLLQAILQSVVLTVTIWMLFTIYSHINQNAVEIKQIKEEIKQIKER